MTTGIQVHTTLAGSLPHSTKGTYESGKEAVCFEYTLTKNPSTPILAFQATFEAVVNEENAVIGKPLRYGICAKKGNVNPIILETEQKFDCGNGVVDFSNIENLNTFQSATLETSDLSMGDKM